MTEYKLNGRNIGFVGAGNMAEALFRGIVDSGMVAADCCSAFDPSGERRELFGSLGCNICENNQELAEKSDILILAVKPQVFDKVVAEFAESVKKDTLVISIAMGVGCDRIESSFPEAVRVVRVMPNTPMMVGCGTAGVARGSKATDVDAGLVLRMFGACGAAIEVEEEMLHAVTALSGSGPAYFFRFVELLEESGKKLGLPAETAKVLAENTFFGSAKLLQESSDNATTLREKVTSPGGTTEAALNAFNENELPEIVEKALTAAEQRSRR